MASYSCPGKIHLIGEHSVVYGKPAILAAIDRRTYVSVRKDRDEKITISSKGFGSFHGSVKDCLDFSGRLDSLHGKGDFKKLFAAVRKTPSSSLRALAGKAAKELGIEEGFSARFKSGIESNAGLGSSAALSLAFTKSLASCFGIRLGDKKAGKISLSVERLFHGRPSGADTAICQRGGIIWFRKGTVKSLNGRKKEILLVRTKRESTTGEMVAKVKAMDPQKRIAIMDELERLTFEMRKHVSKRGNEKTVDIFNSAQQSLRALGISTPKIGRICDVVREIGGGAKLSGAGGGGCVVCIHNDLRSLGKALRREGFHPERALVGERGLRLFKP